MGLFNYNDICTAYLSELHTFRPLFQKHFCIRMFRITGDELYLDRLRSLLRDELPRKIQKYRYIDTIRNDEIDISETLRATMLRNPIEKMRVERRKKVFQENPKLKLYFEALSDLSFYLELKLDQGEFKKEIQEMLMNICNIPWNKELFHEEYLLAHPVLFVNSLYRIQQAGFNQTLNVLQEFVLRNFSPSSLLSLEKLYDQIYVYTHIIINESLFYQQHLTHQQTEEFAWIFDFFKKHFQHFYTKVNLDLVIEVLLCFRLSGIENHEMEKTAEEYLSKFFDSTKHYLKSDTVATFEDMEHANILLLMYLHLPSSFSQIQQPIL